MPDIYVNGLISVLFFAVVIYLWRRHFDKVYRFFEIAVWIGMVPWTLFCIFTVISQSGKGEIGSAVLFGCFAILGVGYIVVRAIVFYFDRQRL